MELVEIDPNDNVAGLGRVAIAVVVDIEVVQEVALPL
jgi:hypothetical protein